MNKLKHYINIILSIITLIMVALIALLVWGLILFAIADWTILNLADSLSVYKLLGGFWLLLVVFSHFFCRVIMYDEKICNFVKEWIKNHPTKWMVIFTLSYINTYWLNWYFIKNRYSKDFVLYNHGGADFLLVMLPILNWIVYYKAIRYGKQYWGLKEDKKILLKLFFKGQLTTYLIKNY